MPNRVTDQPGYILRRRDWRDTSLILDVLTREHGCISLLAKGARRASRRARYEPFVALSLSWSGRAELKTLTGIESETLAVDAANYLPLLYVNDLIAALLPRAEANDEIFDAYSDLLTRARTPIGEPELRRFELALVRQLGYFPDISSDAETGRRIDPAASYRFELGAGFVACDAAARDAVVGRTVLDWLDERYDEAPVRRLAKSVLRATIDCNLHGKTLKSREVYAQIARRK